MEQEIRLKNGISEGAIKLILKNIKNNRVAWLSVKENKLYVFFEEPISEKRIYNLSDGEIDKLKNEMMSVKNFSTMSNLSENSFDVFYADGSFCSFFTKKDGSKVLKYNKEISKGWEN